MKTIKAKSQVTIFTDSVYVKNGITEWIKKWKKNGWKNSNKKPVKNKDLWQRLDEACSLHSIEWCWVKGHSGHEKHERVDLLANKAIDELVL